MRSLLFIALTGEEKGLLGAEWFASHPTVSKNDLVANINMDMPVLLVPGYVTSAIGLLLLLPPVRALVRGVLVKRWSGKVTVIVGAPGAV